LARDDDDEEASSDVGRSESGAKASKQPFFNPVKTPLLTVIFQTLFSLLLGRLTSLFLSTAMEILI
jgi:hypothetical protein